MKVDREKDFLVRIKQDKDCAFVLGNGINRHAYKDSEQSKYVSWDSMISNLWSMQRSQNGNIELKSHDISLTEVFDLMCLSDDCKTQSKEAIVTYFEEHSIDKETDYHKKLRESLSNWGCPVLTTNFDTNLEGDLRRSTLIHPNPEKRIGYTRYYPWSTVHTDSIVHEMKEVESSFGIWHINGMINIKDSIRIGLSDYMGQVNRARNLINDMINNNAQEDENFSGKHTNYWKGYCSWLHIFFNKNLCFIGLSLDVNEVFLRWLLIERQKYFKKFDDVTKKQGWYIYSKEDPISETKNTFLTAVGITPIELNTFDDIYEGVLLHPNV